MLKLAETARLSCPDGHTTVCIYQYLMLLNCKLKMVKIVNCILYIFSRFSSITQSLQPYGLHTARQASLPHHQLSELLKLVSIESVMPSSRLKLHLNNICFKKLRKNILSFLFRIPRD